MQQPVTGLRPILHSTPVWLPQTQTWMHSQVAELQRRGVDAHVVCEKVQNLDQFAVDKIHCLSERPKAIQLYDKAVRKFCLRNHLGYLVRVGLAVGAEIVHSHFGNVGWTNLGAVQRLKCKHVVTFYGLDVNMLPRQFPVWRTRYIKLFAASEAIICEGSHMAAAIVGLGCPSHKIKVHHLGVNVRQINFRLRYWKRGEPLRVLIAASFREKKGIPLAIEALGKFRQKIPLTLTLIGDASDDDASRAEKKKIISALQRSSLAPCTRMLGYTSHARMLEEAYKHHVYLHPSITAANGDTEGGAPVSIIEMMASGIQVISTTHCDIPEVVGPDLHQLLAPERDVDALVECLERLVASRADWQRWAASGRRRVEDEYNQDKQAERLLSIYLAV